VEKIKGPQTIKPYGTYGELVADPDVDIVYVATPHSHHFQNAMLALHAGKHVMCEKALTVTAEQARRLVQTAREKDLFFMEAVWTRYMPLSIQVRELVRSGEIGDVSRVFADFSINMAGDGGKLNFPESDRMVNPNLAGGALLDLGVYPLTWIFQILYHLQPGAEKEKPTVTSSLTKYHTGADDNTVVVCQFPRHKTIGIATTSFHPAVRLAEVGNNTPAIRIQGSKGEIQLTTPACRPTEYRVIKENEEKEVVVKVVPNVIPTDPDRDGWGNGNYWEADEAARCIRDGRTESSTMPHEESIVIMEVMEEALRQGGVVYPELITTDEFDPNSPLNTGKA